ncbi:MAG: hypothetical protein ACJA2F_001451 [Nitriliruptoraceae bacterium]
MLAEQVDYLVEVADDSQTRSVVSSTPMADREWHAAERDVTNHRRLQDELRTTITDLEAERDTLLERLFDLEDDS